MDFGSIGKILVWLAIEMFKMFRGKKTWACFISKIDKVAKYFATKLIRASSLKMPYGWDRCCKTVIVDTMAPYNVSTSDNIFTANLICK